MKKTYICPETELLLITGETQLLGASRVESGGTPGDEYNVEDISYGRLNDVDVWDEE